MTTPESARADFLRRLADADFSPPEGRVVALNAAAGTPLPVTPEAAAEAAAEVRERVDEFAERYWQLAPAERRAEWERLSGQAADAPTAAHLKHLERGLDVVPATHRDPPLADLAAAARELFTLRPRARAVRRLEWLDARPRSIDWHATVGRLWATDAASAELDPPLVSFLDDPTPPPTAVGEGEPPAARRVPLREPPRLRETGRGGGGWGGRAGIGGAGIVLFILARVFLACGGTKTGSSYSPSYSPPTYNYRSYTSPTFDFTPPTYNYTWPTSYTTPTTRRTDQEEGTYTFTADEVRRFEEYRAKPTGQFPPRYTTWLLCGRPKADTPSRPGFSSRP